MDEAYGELQAPAHLILPTCDLFAKHVTSNFTRESVRSIVVVCAHGRTRQQRICAFNAAKPGGQFASNAIVLSHECPDDAKNFASQLAIVRSGKARELHPGTPIAILAIRQEAACPTIFHCTRLRA